MQPENYQLTLLPVPMPPVLPQALQFPEESRWVRLTYEATNAYVTDGCSGHSDSYWVYAALIKHFAIALHLAGCNLGSDDSYPTHALLIDVERSQMWVGEYAHVNHFLNEWNKSTLPPVRPLTPEEQETLIAKLNEALEAHHQKMQELALTGELDRIVRESMAQQQDYIAQIKIFLDGHIEPAKQLLEPIRAEAERKGDVQTLMMLNWTEKN